MSKTQRRWSPQEDSILQKEVEAQTAATHGIVQDWNIIAHKIEGRSNKDCRKRYYNGISEGLKKGPWSIEEDQLLGRLVSKYGSTWAVIAREIETRSADQCSKRWQHCLDPELDRSCWSMKENLALINAVKTHESAWKEIQRLHFPSRSANNVKNQYSVLRRQDLEAPEDIPSCCAAHVEKLRDASQNETNMSPMPNDSSNLLGHFDIDMDSAFDGLTDTDHQNNEFDESYPYPGPEGEDTFQRLATETQSHTMTSESMNYDFGSLGPRERSTGSVMRSQRSLNRPLSVDLNHEAFDFPMQNIVPTSLSYPPTHPDGSSNSCLDSPVDISQSSHDGRHSTENGFKWPNALGPVALEHQQQSPSSGGTTMPPSPAIPNMQTTIWLEGADPSTVSAVIGMLISSKAKFRFETH